MLSDTGALELLIGGALVSLLAGLLVFMLGTRGDARAGPAGARAAQRGPL